MATGDKEKKEKDLALAVPGVGTLSKTADLAVTIPSFQIGMQYLETKLPEVKVRLSFLDKNDQLIKSNKPEEFVTDKKGLLFYPKKPGQVKVKADFYDLDDNLAKCLAFKASKSFRKGKGCEKDLYHVLCHSPDILKKVSEVYKKYPDTFGKYGGKNFSEDVYNSRNFSEEQTDILLSIGKLEPKTKLKVIPLPNKVKANEKVLKAKKSNTEPSPESQPTDTVLGDLILMSIPNYQTVLPKTPVTYKIAPPPGGYHKFADNSLIYEKATFKNEDYSFQWYCLKDPSKVFSGDIDTPILTGPKEYKWQSKEKKTLLNPSASLESDKRYSLNWDVVGHHRVICKLEKKGSKKPRIVQHEQWVDSFENVLNQGFLSIDLKKQVHPDEAVAKKQKEFIEHFNKYTFANKKDLTIERVFEPESTWDNIKFFFRFHDPDDDVKISYYLHKSLQVQRDYIISIKKYLRESDKIFKRIPIKAYYVTEPKHAKHTALNVFIYESQKFVQNGKTTHLEWNIVDWTNPTSDKTSCKKGVGSGKTTLEAIDAAVMKWQEENTYPKGQIKLEIPKIPGEISKPIIYLINTNGPSTFQIIAEVFEWIALAAIIVALIFMPVPGSRVAAAMMWTAIATSTTAAAMHIYDRHDRGVYNPHANVMDQLTIVANLLGGAGILLKGYKIGKAGMVATSASTRSWKIQGMMTAAMQAGKKPENLLIVGSIMADGVQVVLITKDLMDALNNIDQSQSESEILLEMAKVWAHIGLTVGMYTINFKVNSASPQELELQKAFKDMVEKDLNIEAVLRAFEAPVVPGKETTIFMGKENPEPAKIDPEQYHTGDAHGEVIYDAKPFNDHTERFHGETRKVDDNHSKQLDIINPDSGKKFGEYVEGEYLDLLSSNPVYGGDRIILDPNKTTTVTGILSDVGIVARRGNALKGVTESGENIGAINILRSPEWGVIQKKHEQLKASDPDTYWKTVTEEFWLTVNKPWIKEAIARGDKFRLVSDPSDMKKLFVMDKGKFVLDSSGNKIPTIFSREIDYLKSVGYKILPDGTAVRN